MKNLIAEQNFRYYPVPFFKQPITRLLLTYINLTSLFQLIFKMICEIFQLKNFCENNSFNKSFNSMYILVIFPNLDSACIITLFYWKQLSCNIIPNTLRFHFDMAYVCGLQKIFIGFINNVCAFKSVNEKSFSGLGKNKSFRKTDNSNLVRNLF